MKKYILFLILSFLNSNIFADDNIFGYWLTSGSIVKIENCNNQVCGKIVTVFVEDGVDPESILDDNNKDKSLRKLIFDDISNVKEDIIFKNQIGRIRDIQVHPKSGKIFFLAGDSLWLMEKN